MRKILLAAFASLFVMGQCASATDDAVKKIANAVDARYNSLKSFKADFVETYSGNGVSRNESGTLALKRPGKMRWDYTQPAKLFISDGKTAVFYNPAEHQARKTSVKNLDDFRSPLRYLLGKTKLEKEFDHLSIADAPSPKAAGNVVLSGVPKSMADRVNRVLLEINAQSQIQSITIEEADGAVTEFSFSHIVENVPLADSDFKFTPPPGVEMVETNELGGD